MRQLFPVILVAVAVTLVLWDNAYSAAEWSIFLRGFLVGGCVIAVLLNLGRRVANRPS